MKRNRDFIGPAGMGGLVSLWGQSSLIKSIQRGTIVIGSGATSNTTTIVVVDMGNTELRYLGCTCDTNNVTAAIGNASLVFTNATTLTITRITADTMTVTVSYEVIEYVPGILKSVQRGTVAGNATATITNVNTGKAFISYLGETMTNFLANNNQTNMNPYLTLTNATTITGNQVSQPTISWQVTEVF